MGKRKGEKEKQNRPETAGTHEREEKEGKRAVPRQFRSVYSRCTLYTVSIPFLLEV
jgi:hypothetical protein